MSYGVYLWHYPIFYAVSVQGEQWTNLQRVLVAPALTVVAVLGVLVPRRAPRPLAQAAVPGGPAAPAGGRAVRRTAPWPPAPPAPARRHLATRCSPGSARSWPAPCRALHRFRRCSPTSVDGLPQPTGSSSPVGDADRSGYWSLVDLEPTFEDAFDRDDARPTSERRRVGPARGRSSPATWGVLTEAATVSGDATDGTRLAVAPQLVNDGLSRSSLGSPPRAGPGLPLRGPRQLVGVTVARHRSRWTVTQVIDGQPARRGDFCAPVYDGVTITVTQAGPTVRFLIDGVEYFRLLDPAPTAVAASGLAAAGPLAGGGRWDRFLVMASEAAVDAAG